MKKSQWNFILNSRTERKKIMKSFFYWYIKNCNKLEVRGRKVFCFFVTLICLNPLTRGFTQCNTQRCLESFSCFLNRLKEIIVPWIDLYFVTWQGKIIYEENVWLENVLLKIHHTLLPVNQDEDNKYRDITYFYR